MEYLANNFQFVTWLQINIRINRTCNFRFLRQNLEIIEGNERLFLFGGSIVGEISRNISLSLSTMTCPSFTSYCSISIAIMRCTGQHFIECRNYTRKQNELKRKKKGERGGGGRERERELQMRIARESFVAFLAYRVTKMILNPE